MWKEAPPARIEFVTARKGVFEDVLQETVLATYKKGGQRSEMTVGHLSASPGSVIVADEAGGFALPTVPTEPWFMPPAMPTRRRLPSVCAPSLIVWRIGDTRSAPGRLCGIVTRSSFATSPPEMRSRLIWAESISTDGRFEFRSEKRNHRPYFQLTEEDGWLVVEKPFVLLQRTTAKEQARRLIAAEMPSSFLREHGRVTVENHINMLVPIGSKPAVSPKLLAAFLNSKAADRAFRCLSGSVAVSAYELESLRFRAPKTSNLLSANRSTKRRSMKLAPRSTQWLKTHDPSSVHQSKRNSQAPPDHLPRRVRQPKLLRSGDGGIGCICNVVRRGRARHE